MANNVFANGREISCKEADGKTICCFPDVCMTPPENPATPPGVPVPYPNTAFSKDTSDGSKDVKISGQEIILKNKSFFKTSTGDEAGCAAKKGVMTSKIKGKAYFTAWSMDVKVEGENVVRHLDLTTHNHGSNTNTPAYPYLDDTCVEEIDWSDFLPVCDCCGTNEHLPPSGPEITEGQFYGYEDLNGNIVKSLKSKKIIIDDIRSGPCKELLPNSPAKGPCDRYFATSSFVSKLNREKYESYRNYGNFPHLGGEKGAHKVPLSGGGCPIGEGNLQPVNKEKCGVIEDRLGRIQGKSAKAICEQYF